MFQKAIAKANASDDVAIRVRNLIECITYSVFQYTSRGLFECDKLIFASQMTFQVELQREFASSERFHLPLLLSLFLSFSHTLYRFY